MTTYVAGFPHSEICGYNAFYQLTTAYRRLTRPSSPLTAKASTVYAYSLNHTTHMSINIGRTAIILLQNLLC